MVRMIDANAIRYEPMLSARGNGQYEEVMVAYKDQIDDLPTIEERKTGKWILDDEQDPSEVSNGNYRYICSECGKKDIHARTQEVPFCWHCGAKMEGVENG